LDDLRVGLGEYGRVGGAGLGMALDVAQHPQQDLDGFKIAFGRAVDELSNDRFTLADFATPATFGDDDELVQRLVQQGLQVLAPGGRPRGLPD
jgi:hypothetical protein